jgi:predicted NACHT family NTPase
MELVFDTGLNIAVLGEAGAGKTTALQMGARRLFQSGGRTKLVVFAPLAEVVHFLSNSQMSQPQTIEPPPSLDEGMVGFLRSHGSTYTIDEFRRDAQLGGVVLLDGIDEAFSIAPWLISSLVAFSEQYPTLQLITSSRISGQYSEGIPFINVALMPFTPEQRTQFISKWFGDDGEANAAAICLHLRENPEVADVVRNPLLATAMCVFQKNRVPLPTNELRVYEEWLNLLVGVYDRHKNISRLASHRSSLTRLAERIAFKLHTEGAREESLASLREFAVNVLGDTLSREASAKVLEELIDPCNVLVLIGWPNRFGFSHLRFQEYLAARVLKDNREIRLAPYFFKAWWRGVLVLLARMLNSVEWIAGELSSELIDDGVVENVCAIIEAVPREQRRSVINSIAAAARLSPYVIDLGRLSGM